MKLRGRTPEVSLISSAQSAEALTLLAYSAEAVASAAKAERSASYGPSPEGFGPQGGGSVRRIHPRAYARGFLRRRINFRPICFSAATLIICQLHLWGEGRCPVVPLVFKTSLGAVRFPEGSTPSLLRQENFNQSEKWTDLCGPDTEAGWWKRQRKTGEMGRGSWGG